MPPAALSPSSNGQQVDLEEIMNADDHNNISPAPASLPQAENTTAAAASSVSSTENSSDSESS